MRKKKVLFIPESVTLAHVARTYALAKSLDRKHFEVLFACSYDFKHLIDLEKLNYVPIHSVSNAYFLDCLKKNKAFYTEKIINLYINEELELIKTFKPDFVVGDFRLTLSISCKLKNVPYINLCNAYWSPYAKKLKNIIPENRLVSLFGEAILYLPSKLVKKIVVGNILKPFNRVRTSYGLEKFDSLENLYTGGDYTVYCDYQKVIKMELTPKNHFFIGPIQWAPEINIKLINYNSDKKVVYFVMGSSGPLIKNFQQFILDLGKLPYTFYFSTGGRDIPENIPKNIFMHKFLPGNKVGKFADITICNGSPSVYQAIDHGKPVIGICTNYDQHLHMGHVEKSGLGITLRSDCLSVSILEKALKKAINCKKMRQNLDDFKNTIKSNRLNSFNEIMKNILQTKNESKINIA